MLAGLSPIKEVMGHCISFDAFARRNPVEVHLPPKVLVSIWNGRATPGIATQGANPDFQLQQQPTICKVTASFMRTLATHLQPFPIDGVAMKFEDLARHLQPPEGLRRENWKKHANGGGWVETSATVAPTAFIGPNAIVTDEAQVLDTARVEGKAVVGGCAIVADESVITDRARINEMAKVFGKSRVGGTTSVGGYAVLRDAELESGNLRPRTNEAKISWRRAQSQAEACKSNER